MFATAKKPAPAPASQGLRSGPARAEPARPEIPGTPGEPMRDEERRIFERIFGKSLDDVRIHTGQAEEEATEQLGADAFAVGTSIFFARHAYAPGSTNGDRILTHELAHVAQFQEGRIAPSAAGPPSVSAPGDPLEAEAYAIEGRAVAAASALRADPATTVDSIAPPVPATDSVPSPVISRRAAADSVPAAPSAGGETAPAGQSAVPPPPAPDAALSGEMVPPAIANAPIVSLVPYAEAPTTGAVGVPPPDQADSADASPAGGIHTADGHDSPRLIVEDTVPAAEGQIQRSVFVTRIAALIEAAADEELAPAGRTAHECPYLRYWMEHYLAQPADRIERVIRVYARPAAFDLGSVESAILARVRRSIQRWIATRGAEIDTPFENTPFENTADWAPPGSAAAIRSQLGGGRPLEDPLRARMADGLGQNFDDVRVHTDAGAASLAESFSSRAFTLGRDVAFARGAYRPGTLIGDLLIAHELAHVVQQREAGPAAELMPLEKEQSPSLEADADHAAIATYGNARKSQRRPALRSGLRLQRCGPYESPTEKELAEQRLKEMIDQGEGDTTPAAPSAVTATPTGPTLSAAPVPELPVFTLEELQQRLRLTDVALNRLSEMMKGKTGPIKSIEKGRAKVAQIRSTLKGGPEDTRRVTGMQEVVERVEYAVGLLEQKANDLKDDLDHQLVFLVLRNKYLEVLGADDMVAAFNAAEEDAQKLPRRLIEVDLQKFEDHAKLNAQTLTALDKDFSDWITWTRGQLDQFDKDVAALNEAKQKKASDVAEREKKLQELGELIELSLEGLGDFDQAVRAREYMLQQMSLDPFLANGMNKVMTRVYLIRAASMAGKLGILRQEVEKMRSDQDVAAFYRALPAAIAVSKMVLSLGITFTAMILSGGVSGLLTGGGAEAAAGATAGRTVLSILGTAVVEATTFTVVNTALRAGLLGEKPTITGTLEELAWNIGLFSVMKFAGLGISKALTQADLAALRGPVTLAGTFPLLQGYGIVRFRLSEGRWPTSSEIDSMVAENLLMLFASAAGGSVVERWAKAKPDSQIARLNKDYGFRFTEIEKARTSLAEEMQNLVKTGRAGDKAEVAKLRERAAKLEDIFKQVLDEAKANSIIDLTALREELKAMRPEVLEQGAQFVERQLGLTESAGLKLAGERAYTYKAGKTGDVDTRLRAMGFIVEKSQDPGTGLRTITAKMGTDPPITFLERPVPAYGTAEVEIDPANPALTKLMSDLAITDPGAQRTVLRLIEAQISKNPATKLETAISKARKTIRARQAAEPGKISLQDAVLKIRAEGIVAGEADPTVLKEAQALATSGILGSAEWLSARVPDQYVGVIGEWSGQGVVEGAAPTGATVFRNVVFTGDLFTDPAGTVPYIMESGRPAVGTTITEADFVTATQAASDFDVNSVANVKAVEGLGADAATQNTNALNAIDASSSGAARPVVRGSRTLYAKVTKVEGVAVKDSKAVDLTGKVKQAAGGVATDTIGPKGAKGYTSELPYTAKEIKSLVWLLKEIQFMKTSDY